MAGYRRGRLPEAPKVYGVSVQLSEAFRVLSNAQSRGQYDARLAWSAQNHKPATRRGTPAAIAKTPVGRGYVSRAFAAERQGDFASAHVYLMFASQHEPGNGAIARRLGAARRIAPGF